MSDSSEAGGSCGAYRFTGLPENHCLARLDATQVSNRSASRGASTPTFRRYAGMAVKLRTCTVHKELREVPFDIIEDEAMLLSLQEFIQRGSIFSVHIDLKKKL